MASKRQIPTLESDGNGGSTIHFPTTKPGQLLIWLGGGAIVTIIITVLSFTYNSGKRVEGLYRDVSKNALCGEENKKLIGNVKTEVEALALLHASDKEKDSKALNDIISRLGPIETNIQWIKQFMEVNNGSKSKPVQAGR